MPAYFVFCHSLYSARRCGEAIKVTGAIEGGHLENHDALCKPYTALLCYRKEKLLLLNFTSVNFAIILVTLLCYYAVICTSFLHSFNFLDTRGKKYGRVTGRNKLTRLLIKNFSITNNKQNNILIKFNPSKLFNFY